MDSIVAQREARLGLRLRALPLRGLDFFARKGDGISLPRQASSGIAYAGVCRNLSGVCSQTFRAARGSRRHCRYRICNISRSGMRMTYNLELFSFRMRNISRSGRQMTRNLELSSSRMCNIPGSRAPMTHNLELLSPRMCNIPKAQRRGARAMASVASAARAAPPAAPRFSSTRRFLRVFPGVRRPSSRLRTIVPP